MRGLCFGQLKLSSLSGAQVSCHSSAVHSGAVQAKHRNNSFLASLLHAAHSDGISLGRESSSCCPCLGLELAPHRFFFGQDRHLWGCSGWQLSDKELLVSNPLGN